jgi:prepilin-type N-terminal cleavage/methylation domain-containing protein
MIESRRGFTLIELMIVVAIIGVLAAIAIPTFSNLVGKSQEGSTKSNLGSIRSALAIYYGDNEGLYPYDALDSLKTTRRYLENFPPAILPKTVNSVGHGTTTGVGAGTFPANVTDVAGGVNGWAYDNSGGDIATWGLVVVNCTHMDLKGYPWTSY